MNKRKTFHVQSETLKTFDDIYMYFMQQGNKRSYSDLLSEAIELFKEKLIAEQKNTDDKNTEK